MYQVFSGGKEWYCPGCEADGSYEEGQAPRRAKLLQSEEGRTALRAEMDQETARRDDAGEARDIQSYGKWING